MLTKLVIRFAVCVAFVLSVSCSDAGDSALTLPTSKPPSTVVGGADFGGPQLTTNRSNDHRSVCVDFAGGTERELIDQPTLEDAGGLVEEDLAGSALSAVVLSLGCPKAAAEDPANRNNDLKGGAVPVVGQAVLSPSAYSVHIYYVSPKTLDDWFGPDAEVGISTEEMFCGNPPAHNCAAVTTGVYVAPGTDADAIYQGLRTAFGLR